MRTPKSRVRDSFAVSADGFAWDLPVVATLRHSTLPWFDLPFGASFDAVPLVGLGPAGERDRLSLIAQFAAHCAFLQFSGIADVEFDASEWAVVRRRGTDVRLLRVGFGKRDEPESSLASIQAFAAAVNTAHLPTLHRAWARPESLFRELFITITRDAAADLRWTRAAASGVLLAPGVQGARLLLTTATGTFRSSRVRKAFQTIAALEPGVRVVLVDGTSPLVPFSALEAFGVDLSSRSVATIADNLIAVLESQRHLIQFADEETIDAASRQVLDIARSSSGAIWVTPADGASLPDEELFVVAPRLAALRDLQARASAESEPEDWLREFVQGDSFADFLGSGVVSGRRGSSTLAEPKRSWLAALALLGRRVEQQLALRFLREFFFSGELSEMVVPDVTTLDDESLVFVSEQARTAAAAHIPEASRAALCRAAARLTTGVQSALLHLDGGEPQIAVTILEESWPESSSEDVIILTRIPREVITPALSVRLASALIDEGRYADALQSANALESGQRELVMARAERRRGEYAPALARMERMSPRPAEAEALRVELLRLAGRAEEAREAAERAVSSAAVRDRLLFELALIALDSGIPGEERLPAEPYLRARLETYRALQTNDFESAAGAAARAEELARKPIDRIDASLDRIFALFSSGQWSATRHAAVEALSAIDETQGDRAAGAAVFVLAFLAADDGQWSHAESRLARLRELYATVGDSVSSVELELIEAQLAFSRGRFDSAESPARAVLANPAVGLQIREAAALILDEIDWMRGNPGPMRSTGSSSNAELTRRRTTLAAWRASTEDETESLIRSATTRSARLAAFRYAIARGRDDVAAALAQELGAEFSSVRDRAGIDARTLRAAAVASYPFSATALPVGWRSASRNRLGRWSQGGSLPPVDTETLERIALAPEPDWLRAANELLYVEGCAKWPVESRNALAALFAVRAENERLRRIVEQHEASTVSREEQRSVEGMLGSSPAMRAVHERIARVAARDVVVLVLGESGTGKELVANAVHKQSARRARPFTAVNCAALPENLIESELFGHARGAFTGADRDRPGLIETTDGGTLFLDEIGEMPLPAQAKVLRFLQEGEFRRVGESTNRMADVRIVCATNRDLEQRVAEGKFRQDLFYRVHGVDIVLPPLRERGGDIIELAVRFLEHERRVHRDGPLRMSPDVERLLLGHAWPGNIRELQQVIRGSHALAAGCDELKPEHLTGSIRHLDRRRVPTGAYQDAVARFRRELIERSLTEAGGNQNRAASMLQISRQALGYQIRELGILVKRPRRAES